MQKLLSAIVGGNAGAGKGGPGFFGREYKIAGRHLVEERPLSEGGFSFVVQVRDLEEGQSYALKKILCQDEESFASAQREVDILENLPAHKNIVGYFGHAIMQRGTKGKTREVLILLELCTGGHLLDFLDKHRGVLPEKKLLKAFLDVSEAIFCLHSHSPPIQHRDLKLENVLLGGDGFWKVVDFGSWSNEAVDLASVATKQLAIIGEELEKHTTMMYRPPEMVDVHQRFPVTCAVDIWMLGCVLYTLMYNKHPFQDSAAFAIRNANYSIPERKPALSVKIIDLLIWLLSQDPRHRPNSRKLVTLLWQWDDLEFLELPEIVAQRRQQLLKCASGQHPAFQPRVQKNGAVAAKSAVAPKKMPSPQPHLPNCASNVTLDLETPWIAFEDSSDASKQLARDDWAFDSFQSAGHEKAIAEVMPDTLPNPEGLEVPEVSEVTRLPEVTEVAEVPGLPENLEVLEDLDIPEVSVELVDSHVESSEIAACDVQPEPSATLTTTQNHSEDSIDQELTSADALLEVPRLSEVTEVPEVPGPPENPEVLEVLETREVSVELVDNHVDTSEIAACDVQPEPSATLTTTQNHSEDSIDQELTLADARADAVTAQEAEGEEF